MLFGKRSNENLKCNKVKKMNKKITSKETKRQAITKDKKNEMKAKPIEF